MKKLVILINGLRYGGMERVAFIMKELLSKDFEITIVTQFQNNSEYEIKSEYYNLNVSTSFNKFANFFKITFIKRLIKCIKMKKELKPDYVFSLGMYSNYLNVFSNFFMFRKPKIITGIRSYDWLTIPFINKKLDKFVMNKFDYISSVSKLIALDAEKYWNIPLQNNYVIYNPYNINYIEKKSYEKVDDFEFDKDCFYLITIGRLVDQKGFNHLIRVVSEVIDINPKIKLLILGTGPQRDKIFNMIKDYKKEKDIFLLGGKKNPYKYIKHCNLYILSSHYEGFPNALCEAMCVGIPVISVNCKSGPSEILVDKNDINYNNDDYYIGNYGIITKEMNIDYQYDIKKLSESEKSLKKAIIYCYNNKNIIRNISKKAKKHMNIFSDIEFINKFKKMIN